MIKKIVKLFTIALVLLVMLMPNVDAATTITVDNGRPSATDTNSYYVTNKGTLTVNNVGATDTFSVYKILDAYYNQTTNVITYEFTAEFKAFLNSSSSYRDLTVEQYYQLTSGDINSGSTKTSSTLDKLSSAYAAYIKTNSVTGVAMTVTETTATITADAGTYLVLPTLTNRVYAVMVGNIDFTAEGTAWNLNNATINAKVSDAGVDKSVGASGYADGSFGIGSEFKYSLIATVPTYPTNATNKKYVITDTFSTGLTFGGLSSITVSNTSDSVSYHTDSDGVITDDLGNTVATATFLDQKITIVFNLDYVDVTRIYITYTAKLNENAVIGSAGNVNSVQLEYSNDPYGTGSFTTDPTDSEATAYTYGLEVYVYDADDNGIALKGATFDIYSDAELLNKIGTITTDDAGYVTYKGIAAGTYYLKQVTAPTGYSLIRDAIEVEITEDGTEGATAGDGYTRKEIPQAKVGLLPSTGGIGTILYTIIGLIVIVAAISLVIVYRKNKDKENMQF